MLYYLSLVALAGVFLSVFVYDDAVAIALGGCRSYSDSTTRPNPPSTINPSDTTLKSGRWSGSAMNRPILVFRKDNIAISSKDPTCMSILSSRCSVGSKPEDSGSMRYDSKSDARVMFTIKFSEETSMLGGLSCELQSRFLITRKLIYLRHSADPVMRAMLCHSAASLSMNTVTSRRMCTRFAQSNGRQIMLTPINHTDKEEPWVWGKLYETDNELLAATSRLKPAIVRC